MENATQKRLIFVTSRLPWPTNSGRKLSLYHYCRGLAEMYGYEVTLFVFPEHDQPREDKGKPDFISRVAFAAPFSRAEQCFNLLTKTLLGGAPAQCALYESRKSKKLLDRLVKETNPDVMVFDMIRTAPYMKHYAGRVKCILDLDDLLSLRYRRQLTAPAEGHIAGRYAGAMRPVTRRLLAGPLGRVALKTEAKRVARAEKRMAKRADGVIFVSREEAVRFNQALGTDKAVAVPIGVDMRAFSAAHGMEKTPNTVGFVGNLSVPANVASLAHIAEQILPLLDGVTLEVVGYTPADIRTKYAKHPQLRLQGEVEDLPAAMGRWQALLAPIAFGSGLKTKILEAMAAGLPVVTNAVGAEGIGATDGTHLILAKDAEATAKAVMDLLENKTKAKEIGLAAQEFAKENYAWEKCFQAFEALGLFEVSR